MEADKKEKTRHNQFIKTAQPYKPKVSVPPPPPMEEGAGLLDGGDAQLSVCLCS